MSLEVTKNGWHEWSKHVLLELERHNGLLEKVVEGMNKLDRRITIIEVKSGLWGVLGGLLSSGILYLALENLGGK